MAQVIDICSTLEGLNMLPSWFREIYRKPVVYHRDCLIDFKIEKDSTRFAGGVTWFCKHCNREVFSYEEFIKKFDYFAVFMLFCHNGCNALWRMDDIDEYLKCMWEFPLTVRTGKLEWDILNWIAGNLRLSTVEY
jgi:hypothetical protein